MTTSGHVVYTKVEEVIFGKPADESINDIVSRLGAKRVFLMVSNTLNHTTDEIEKIRDVLGDRYVGEFDSMPPHTPRSAVIEATAKIREANADLILTLGGGSIIDGAKAAQLCLANDVDTVEGMDMFRSVPDSDGKMVPPTLNPINVRQISIPTTLSGGEFSKIAGISNEATKTKELYTNASIVPQAIVLDPAVTLHTPEWLWLSTGIRAIDHCVEGLCSTHSNAYGDAQAAKGLNLLVDGLRRVKADPTDLQARLDCQMGTWLSVGTVTAGALMGASHAIGYILGTMYDVPHGHTSCVMLPSVMRWNSEVNAERQETVALAMGSPGQKACEALKGFIQELGMPSSLSEVGIGEDKFEEIAKASMGVPWIPHNPRSIKGPDCVMEILEIAS